MPRDTLFMIDSRQHCVCVFTVFSSSSESSTETDNEQNRDGTQNPTFSSFENSNSFQLVADDASSNNEAQHSVKSEGGALPLPSWLDASSQDSNAADARVQSIRDIIRVGGHTSV